MILRRSWGRWRFQIIVNRVDEVSGVTSLLEDKNHILLWEFDSIPLRQVRENLTAIQKEYYLPNINILRSSKGNHYHAYCLRHSCWQWALEVVISTRGIDLDWFEWSVKRRQFTLRISPKNGYAPKLVARLTSDIDEDVDYKEIAHYVRYEIFA